jgi:nucleoside-diphosphate-sugar epimerase
VRVDRRTGAALPQPVEAAELLVHSHRDKHLVPLAMHLLASRLIQITGNETLVARGLKLVNGVGNFLGDAVGRLTGSPERGRRTKELLGISGQDIGFRFRNERRLSEKEAAALIEDLQRHARSRLASRGSNPRLHVLLTGATGFLGKELLLRMAEDRRIAEVVAVVRPEQVRDPRTGALIKTLSPQERGAALLHQLRVGAATRKFRFVRGDVEKPGLGIAPAERARLRWTLTHVIHCAASVSFDGDYESSFRANVLGSRNALAFSRDAQRAQGSPFVSHVAIETSYIHGRRRGVVARESGLIFPRHFYNNFYELTKAMASIETDRALIEAGLRVVQILPSIIIGHSRSGTNRGDTKVVNAPVNAFGRARETLDALGGSWREKARAWLVGTLATTFPADRSAELNLIPVDRVAHGILAALYSPEAIGNRIHLATDNRIRSEEMVRITREELGVHVRLADPTLTRTLTLPLAKALLHAMNEPTLASVMERLGSIFVLQRVGPAGSRRGQRRADPAPPRPPPRHGRGLPHALPAQQVRARVRQGAERRGDRTPGADLGGGGGRDRVRRRTSDGLARSQGVRAPARRADRPQNLPAQAEMTSAVPGGVV